MSQIVQAAPTSVRSPLLYAEVAAGPLYVGIGTLEAVSATASTSGLLAEPAGRTGPPAGCTRR